VSVIVKHPNLSLSFALLYTMFVHVCTRAPSSLPCYTYTIYRVRKKYRDTWITSVRFKIENWSLQGCKWHHKIYHLIPKTPILKLPGGGEKGGRKNLKLHVESSEDSFERAFQDENNAQICTIFFRRVMII